MAEMENMLAQMQALQHEINTLRESQANVNDASRSNLQKVHIPKFNKHNPHLWFSQIERSFALCSITSDSDKFDLVSIDKFGTLKERLITKFAKTSESKLRRLLQGCEAAGKKPSEILSTMRRLAPGKQNEAIIRTLFLGKMPDSIRPILSVWKDDDLEKLSETTDKMLDANYNVTSSVSVAPLRFDASVPVDAVASHMTFSDVCQAIKNLTDEVRKIHLQQNDNRVKSNRQQSRSRSRSRNSYQNSTEAQLCWYHTKFGDAAQHCKPTCRWKPNSENYWGCRQSTRLATAAIIT
ncbi:uncharacterized protein LOC111686380 [Lucilia cuprina]|uniref:uncharacterized protein LOC111686380 n=1 Tax=Lucilia cuprina TaxID=7375 RepID=UPI001F05B1CC|nr:uncharacterized protein LOC111686380 [Lucilia cuprina]